MAQGPVTPAPVRNTVVTVVNENGESVEGVDVEYKVFSDGAFVTVARIKTDGEGCARLDTGPGDRLVWAGDGAKFGIAKLDGEEVTLVLNHFEGEVFSLDVDMVPSAEPTPEIPDAGEAVPALAPLGDVVMVAPEGLGTGYLSLSKIEDGYARRAAVRHDALRQEGLLQLGVGYYMVTTGCCLPDGSVLVRLQTFSVLPDQVNDLPVAFRSAEN